MTVKEWLSANWIKIVSYTAVLVIGVGIGWGVKPSVVETKEKVVEKQVTTEAQKELMASFENLRLELQKVRETQVVEKYHREVLETKLKDGTYTKKTTVDKNIDSHTKETETRVEVKVVEVEKKTETIKEVVVDRVVTKEVKAGLAQWHLSVGGALGPQLDPLRLSGTFDVAVERRIIGPFFVGLTANIGTDFQKVNGFGGGLRLGAEF